MRTVLVLLLLSAIGTAQPRGPRSPLRSVSKKELRDRIAGGWAGQMMGASTGLPAVAMTFALVLDEAGLSATTGDFARALAESKHSLSHANMAARRNLKRGIPATEAGTPRYNAHSADSDFQMASAVIGLMSPGMPRAAAEIAQRAGRVTSYGDGIAGGVFVACMYATAFFETNPRRIVASGLACLPPNGRYAAVIREVLSVSAQNPGDWRKSWRAIARKCDADESCPSGALRSFNNDATRSGAGIALALLYGRGDFGRTIKIGTGTNTSSAAGILGVILGYKRIPQPWKSDLDRVATRQFEHTDYTLQTIIESTEYRSGGLAKRNGGKVEDQRLLIRTQRPRPVTLPAWSPGKPSERIPAADPRWSWSADWQMSGKTGRLTAKRGAEASISFDGTGAILTGRYLKTGGMADIYLDGRLDRTVDAYLDEEGSRDRESVWHAYGLTPGKHTVRVIVKGEPYPDSEGSDVSVEDLIVFR